jgi:hypothetical protein
MSELLRPKELIIPNQNPPAANQELIIVDSLNQAQKEVMGMSGLGSIRVEDQSRDQIEQDQENHLKQALNPENIVSLKQQYQERVAKLTAERSFSCDKRVYKEDPVNKQQLKQELIDKYLQVGAKPGQDLALNDQLKQQIAKEMDLSYSQLEAKIKPRRTKVNRPNATSTAIEPVKPDNPIEVVDESNQTAGNLDLVSQPEEPEIDQNGRYGLAKALEEAYTYNIEKAGKYTSRERKSVQDEIDKYAQLAAIGETVGFKAAKNPKGNRRLSTLETGFKVTDSYIEMSQSTLERYRRSTNKKVRERLVAAGADESTIKAILKLQDQTLARQLGASIAANKQKLLGLSQDPESTDQNKLKNFWSQKKLKFYDWWIKQDGGGDKLFSKGRLKGTFKRAAALGAIGIPIGFVLGSLAVPAGVSGIAGAIGVVLASRSNGLVRGMTYAHVDKRANALSDKKREQLIEAQVQKIHDYYQNLDEANPYDGVITSEYAWNIKAEVAKNKARTISAIGAVALGGLAAYSFSLLGNSLLNGSNVHQAVSSRIGQHLGKKLPSKHGVTSSGRAKSISKTNTTYPSVSSEQQIGQTFQIKPGAGVTNEISNYAASRGKPISGAEAYRIYLQLKANNGSNLIDINNKIATAYHGSSVWIDQPGVGKWAPGVQQQLDKLLT